MTKRPSRTDEESLLEIAQSVNDASRRTNNPYLRYYGFGIFMEAMRQRRRLQHPPERGSGHER